MAGFTPLSQCGEDPIGDMLSAFPERPAVVNVAVDAPNATLLPQALATEEKGWAEPLLGRAPNFKDSSATLKVEVHALVEGTLERAIRLSQSSPKHLWLSMMECLPKKEGLALWVDLLGNAANVWAHDGTQWMLVTQLSCVSEEEFLYHLSNICEQLSWDRKQVEVEVSGWKAAAYKEFVQPYFGTVQLFSKKDLIKVSSAFGSWDAVAMGTLIRL